MKFLHTADLHLDSPLRGLERYEGAPVHEIRGATRKALANLIDLACVEKVDFVLIAGDVYDGDWRDYNTGLFFARQMARLREAGIRVFLIRGNHDAASQITRELALPENVFEFPTRQPESVVLEDLGVAIHGQGFAAQTITTDLSEGYPLAQKGLLNIGLLHTCASGRDGHDSYAPCTLAGLGAKGYAYWALGHIHQREELSREPWVLFPGNIQGRHARETGAKGCTLVTANHGQIERVEPRAIDVGRWCQCAVGVQGAADLEEVLDRCRQVILGELQGAEDRWLAVRLQVQGPCRFQQKLAAQHEQFLNQCRALANDLGAGQVWIEKVHVRTVAEADFEDVADRTDPLGDLVRYIRELPGDAAALGQLLEEFKDLKQKLPLEIRDGADGLNLDDPALIRTLLPEIEQILIPRLMQQEVTR